MVDDILHNHLGAAQLLLVFFRRSLGAKRPVQLLLPIPVLFERVAVERVAIRPK